jgi:hypothetical protein
MGVCLGFTGGWMDEVDMTLGRSYLSLEKIVSQSVPRKLLSIVDQDPTDSQPNQLHVQI